MQIPLSELERLAVAERPAGRPLMRQSWGKLLFMHWQIDPHRLREIMPAELEIDTFDGSAWVAIVPFTMWDTRASFLPPLPGLSNMHELNVRTYVHYHRVPGVWFFSLDCTSAAAVLGARNLYHLPYYNADIQLQQDDQAIDYSLRRTDEPPAAFQASWRIGSCLPNTFPDSLEFFLTERYCLYSEHKGEIYRARIHHRPWPLAQAQLDSLKSTMLEAAGIQTPARDPLLHYAEEINVEIWPLRKL
jgi:uncharacterized protein YqjF (DUF2071 family)